MKIIITENKLERVIDKWLSNKYSELDVYDHDNQPWIMYVDKNGEIIFLYQYKENELYVDKRVLNILLSLFSTDEDRIYPILTQSFEKYTGLKSDKVMPWDFTTASDWKKIVRWESKKRLS